MDLSIVIPAYKEAHKIERDVRAASAFLVENGISGEVIIADDGSPDDTAGAAEKMPVPPGIELRVLRLPHKGKGSAVREGMAATRGQYAMFADSGVCVPYSDALPALELLRAGQFEIANGSRKMRGSVIDRSQTLYRRILSWIFRRVVLAYMNLPRDLTDTQCGFKLYQGDVARKVYAACRTDGFMFDLEVLMRARKAGYRMTEFPVHWACDPDSRLRPSRILGNTIADLIAVKRMVQSEGSG
jgi:dolichyl-phosphate beta-glucosyltransferase